MVCQVKLTPLYGVFSEGPVSYLLDIDGFCLLLDCGWDDSFDVNLLEPVKRVLPRIKAVLLSHPDLSHVGALPYLMGRCGLSVPVYCTYPVQKMGEMLLYDHFLSRQTFEDFDVFTLNDVDIAFSHFRDLRYMQQFAVPDSPGLVITPYTAGHYLGGSIWQITKGSECVVYAVDYNHRQERHLNGTQLEKLFERPALLITDAYNAHHMPLEKGRREQELIDVIMATLRGSGGGGEGGGGDGGSVLIPVDASGRVLELVLLLERHWQEHKLVYPLVLLTCMSYNTLDNAKSQLHWMNEHISRSFEKNRENPFHCRFMKLCHNQEELASLPHGPKVVLASTPTLEAGWSKQLLTQWAGSPRNLILFAERAAEGTIAHTMQHHSGREPLRLRIRVSRRVPLEGEELEEHLRAKGGGSGVAPMDEDGPAAGGEDAAAGATSPDAPQRKPSADQPLRSSSGTLSKLVKGASGGVIQVLQDAETSAAAEVLIDGFTVPPGAAAPMFPMEDEPFLESYDEYGAALDHAAFKTQVSPLDAVAEKVAQEEAEEEETPTKVVCIDMNIAVLAQVKFVDFEGRSDGRSMRTIITHVAPRNLVLVHGSRANTTMLQQHCQKELAPLHTKVYAPEVGQELTMQLSSSYQLSLSEQLLASVKLQGASFEGQMTLAWVDGMVQAPEQPGQPMVLTLGEGAVEGQHGGIFIGDVRLSDLKAALADLGIPSEFQAGSLVCSGGRVTVKRSGAQGRLELEGALCEQYYQVRDALYGMHHVC